MDREGGAHRRDRRHRASVGKDKTLPLIKTDDTDRKADVGTKTFNHKGPKEREGDPLKSTPKWDDLG
jgi:hypothetical protein